MESDLLSFVDRIDKSHQAVTRLCKALLLELIILLASARSVRLVPEKKIGQGFPLAEPNLGSVLSVHVCTQIAVL